MVKQPNQQVRILIEGLRRFHTGKFTKTLPYLLAEVEYHDEPTAPDVESKALARTAKKLFKRSFSIRPHSMTNSNRPI